MPVAIRWRGGLQVPALAAVLDEIVRRHETLRTTFATTETGTVQVVAPRLVLPLSVVDLTALDGERKTGELDRLAAGEARAPFDLAAGPLLRVCLLRLQAPGEAGEEHVLLATLHHIVSDGWSQGLLFQELSALYGAVAAGGPSPLPELPIQYADFAAWQRDWLRGEVLEAQLAYWRRRLAGVPAVLELPTDRPRPALSSGRGAREAVDLPAGLADALAALCPDRGGDACSCSCSRPSLALLRRYSGQDDLPVGTPVAGRVRVETEPLIGFFVNTLVLRTDALGRSHLPRAAGPRPRGGARRLRPSGRALREAGRRAAAAAGPGAHAALPGPDGPPERAGGSGGARRADAGPSAGGERGGQVRPDAVAGARAGLASAARVPDRPVRPDDDPAPARPPRSAAPGSRRRARPAAVRPAAPDRGRAAAGLGMERQRHRLPRRHRLSARADRGAGGALARRRGAGLRGGAADLPASSIAGPTSSRATCAGWASGRRGWSASALERSLEMVVALLGGAQGGRRLRSARPRLPGGAAAAHAGGLRRAGPPHPGAAARPAAAGGCGAERAPALPRQRVGGGGEPARGAAASRWIARRRRLRDLHLRLDRPAQGGGQHAIAAIVNRLLWMQDAYGLDAGGPRPPEDPVQLRRLGLGVLLASDRRGAAGGRPRRRPSGPGLPGRDDRRRRGSPPCTSCPPCSSSSWKSRGWTAAPGCGA